MNTHLIAEIILMTAMVAFTNIAGKVAVNEIDPFAVVFLRFVLAWLTLFIIIRIRNKPVRFHLKDWPALVFLTLTGVLLNQNFFVAGLKFTVPSHPSLLYATTPFWVMLMAALRRSGDSFSRRRVVSLLFSIGGVAIVFGKHLFVYNASILTGDTILMFAVLCWAAYTAFGKDFVNKYGAITSTFLFLSVAIPLYLPVGLWRLHQLDWNSISMAAWSGVIYMGIFTSGISYILYYHILKQIPASRLALIISLQPPTTILFSVVLGFEPLEWTLLAGLTSILFAVYIANSSIKMINIRRKE